jgi:hypothetical protein
LEPEDGVSKFPIKKAEKFEVKKGVPLPPKNRKKEFPAYPFGEMDVGDSFDIKVKENRTFYSYEQVVYNAWRAWIKEHADGLGILFTKRRLYDEGVVRVWRIK